ncbi:7546_t:CDS:1, partial [Funneliformis caledonium]
DELTLKLLTTLYEPIITKNTNIIEVDSVEKNSNNSFNKEKNSEIFTLETTAQKTTISFDTSILSFKTPSIQIIKFLAFVSLEKFSESNF